MNVTRRNIKQGIIKILSEWLLNEYHGDYDKVSNDILTFIPKPEKCVMYKKLSPAVHVNYFKCSKCGGVQFDVPDMYCPHCGRRIITTEDMTKCQ